MRRSKIEEEEDVDVNITPLLDIVFIMLIFFIVTSTFIREPGVDINRPPAETADDAKPAVLVAINSANEIWINKEIVSLEGVRVVAARFRAENPKGSAVIQADEDAHTRFLVEVMDQLGAAGFDQVFISTEQE
ncbi:MAG: biopolymer transporter ExbD [Parvularculaceae bacterium]